MGRRTGHKQCSKDDSLFRIGFVLIVAPFHKGSADGPGIECGVPRGRMQVAVICLYEAFLRCWGGHVTNLHPLFTPERALLRTKGFCSASGDAIAHGENLYTDMVNAW